MAFLAPAGTPVTLSDVLGGMADAFGNEEPEARLAYALRDVSGAKHAWPVSSGRAGMSLMLEAMRATAGDDARDEVIIPAYTCYSVPAAIERAGLRPRLCDIDPDTLSLDLNHLRAVDFGRVLAVVSSNLYGLPNDLAGIEGLCRKRGVYLLDDAAQALGAQVAGRQVGTFGDAGLYSFDKGKIISTIQGGAIVGAPGALASRIAERVERLPPSAMAERAGNFLKLGVYSVFLRPSLYPLVRMLPFTGLGHTPYQPQFPVTTLSRFQSAVAIRLLGRLNELASIRRRNANSLEAELHGLRGMETFRAIDGAVPAYARYPVRVRDPARRNDLIAALNGAGIGATASYPRSLADVPEVQARLAPGRADCPAARTIAATIVTLPTHAYCPPDLAQRVATVIRACNV